MPDLHSIARARRVTSVITVVFGLPAVLCQWLYVLLYQQDNLFLLYLPLPMALLLLASLVRTVRLPGTQLPEQILPASVLVYTLACMTYRAAFPKTFPPDIDLIMLLLLVLAGTSVCLRLPPVRAGIALVLLLVLHSLPLLVAIAERRLIGHQLLSGVMTELSLTSLLALMYTSVWTQLALGRSEATSRQMTQLSQTDHLTGLRNRRSLYASIESLMAEGQQAIEEAALQTADHAEPEPASGPPRPTTFSLVLLDIDHFKSVNDTFGHASGDTVLCGVAGVLQTFVRQRDLAGRWGGEEFLMALPGVPLERASMIAERLRQQLAEAPILPNRPITASFGVTAWLPGETPEALIARADAAMYHAKNGGRNRVEASSALQDTASGTVSEAWHTQLT